MVITSERPRRGGSALGVLATLALVAASGSARAAATEPAAPAPGRYEATLCVSHADETASCGAAELDVGSSGNVRIQVSDIVYRLRLRTGSSAVVVMHGAMQIDEFATGAEWAGASLRFTDAEKRVRYEVKVGAARRAAR